MRPGRIATVFFFMMVFFLCAGLLRSPSSGFFPLSSRGNQIVFCMTIGYSTFPFAPGTCRGAFSPRSSAFFPPPQGSRTGDVSVFGGRHLFPPRARRFSREVRGGFLFCVFFKDLPSYFRLFFFFSFFLFLPRHAWNRLISVSPISPSTFLPGRVLRLHPYGAALSVLPRPLPSLFLGTGLLGTFPSFWYFYSDGLVRDHLSRSASARLLLSARRTSVFPIFIRAS